MIDLKTALAKVTDEHREALEWFHLHSGTQQTWSDIYAHADDGARLVNQAKGIYEPHYTDYALSVRQTLDSPYADLEIEHRSDGSWIYPYFQEGADPDDKDKSFTNRGLIKCMHDGVPVGVLVQTKPMPGVIYDVVGLAIVTEWKDGYFILEGFSDLGKARSPLYISDAGHARAAAAAQAEIPEDFEAGTTIDQRQKTVAEVVRRRGQQRFRKALLAAYQNKCAITGCDAVDALEAAHIEPFKGDQSHHPQNGLLLRADLHSLFDLGLIAIESSSMTILVEPRLRNSSYGKLQGQKLSLPVDAETTPSREALDSHRGWAGI